MAFHLENKVIFISGGAGDIGSAIVKGFVDESWQAFTKSDCW